VPSVLVSEDRALRKMCCIRGPQNIGAQIFWKTVRSPATVR
jgi:hypothetical protein